MKLVERVQEVLKSGEKKEIKAFLYKLSPVVPFMDSRYWGVIKYLKNYPDTLTDDQVRALLLEAARAAKVKKEVKERILKKK